MRPHLTISRTQSSKIRSSDSVIPSKHVEEEEDKDEAPGVLCHSFDPARDSIEGFDEKKGEKQKRRNTFDPENKQHEDLKTEEKRRNRLSLSKSTPNMKLRRSHDPNYVEKKKSLKDLISSIFVKKR